MKPSRQIGALALVAGLSLLTSCSAPSPGAMRPRFTEEGSADLIARYYSDQTSYLLKPLMKDGSYRTVCDRARVLELAREQPRHELAVVVLIHYPSASTEEPVKLAWANDLRGLGYRRIVFLRGNNRMEVNGLPVLETPPAAATFAGR
jgi:hypothetical protein